MHLFIYACTWVKGRRASLYLFPTLILWMKLQTNWKLEVKLSLESDFKEIFQSTDNTTKALTENHWKMIHSMCLREIWQVNHLASAHIIRNFGAIALSYPPPPPPPLLLLMIHHEKTRLKALPLALTLTLGGTKVQIAPKLWLRNFKWMDLKPKMWS